MSDSNNGNVGTSFVGLLTLLFIGLKLSNCIDWSWWWVISPIFIIMAVALFVISIGVVIKLVTNALKRRSVSKVIKKCVWPLKKDNSVSVILKSVVTVGIVIESKEGSVLVNTRAGDFEITKDLVFDASLVNIWHSQDRKIVMHELAKIGIKVKDKIL